MRKLLRNQTAICVEQSTFPLSMAGFIGIIVSLASYQSSGISFKDSRPPSSQKPQTTPSCMYKKVKNFQWFRKRQGAVKSKPDLARHVHHPKRECHVYASPSSPVDSVPTPSLRLSVFRSSACFSRLASSAASMPLASLLSVMRPFNHLFSISSC